MRALRWPRAWLGAWALMIVAVIVLSLMPKPPIPPSLTLGKLDHLLAYFVLSAFAMQLYVRRRAQLGAALALALLGIALEFAQGYLTTYRHMAVYDALIDTLGVALGLAIASTSLATALLRMENWLGRAAR
jgi:VanZ family protein